jgi:4'-phosphopantetheinyl transferase
VGSGIAEVTEVAASEVVLARWAEPMAALTTVERDRAGALVNSQDAADFVAAHLLARECAARLSGVPAADVVVSQLCDRCGGPHGRPSVVGLPWLRLSWGHSAGHVAAAACDRAIGVDIENRQSALAIRAVDEQLLRRSATPAEAAVIVADPDPVGAFLQLWVMKEALVKAGAITLDDFAAVELEEVGGFALMPLHRPGLAAGLAVRLTD